MTDAPSEPYGPRRPSPAEGDRCAVCPERVLARGWCSRHYQRWNHHGHTGLYGDVVRADAAQHGSRRKYQGGCRCLRCGVAESRYQAAWNRGERARVDVELVRQQIRDLVDAGWTYAAIQREAGLSNSTLWTIRNTDQTHVNSRTADAIAAVHDALVDPEVVDRTWRLVGYLVDGGWSESAIGAWITGDPDCPRLQLPDSAITEDDAASVLDLVRAWNDGHVATDARPAREDAA